MNKAPRGALVFYQIKLMVRPIGIEPTPQVPETCALSTELRAHYLCLRQD
jgi:hypothetical protein